MILNQLIDVEEYDEKYSEDNTTNNCIAFKY